MLLYIFAYLLLVGFFVIEFFVRQGKDTKNMDRTAHDRGSTTFVSAVMGTAFILLPISPLLNYLGFCAFHNQAVGWVGVLFGIGGLIVRYLAFTTLGRFFSRILRETEDHALVTNGIYKYIRHPGYLSDFLIFIGTALAMGNMFTLVLVVVTFVPAYAYRMHTEERMLIEIFGDQYRLYQTSSKRLIPFIF